jgi:hypothetical protein
MLNLTLEEKHLLLNLVNTERWRLIGNLQWHQRNRDDDILGVHVSGIFDLQPKVELINSLYEKVEKCVNG